MSAVVRHIPYKNRLAALIRAPGGSRVEDALAAAAANLEEIREPCVSEIDARLAFILEVAKRPIERGMLSELYTTANDIVGTAGLFGLTEMGQAAYSLCELIDRNPESCDASALAVHVNGLRMLRQAEMLDPAQRADMLAGLEKVVQRCSTSAAG